MKKKLIAFIILTFITGNVCSSFAIPMSSSNERAFSDVNVKTGEIPDMLRSRPWIHPSVDVRLVREFNPPVRHRGWDHKRFLFNERCEPIPESVPEPLTIYMLGSGLIAIGLTKRRIKR